MALKSIFRLSKWIEIQPGDGVSRTSEVSPRKRATITRGPDGAADIHRSQTRSQVLRTYQGSRGNAEPHRGSEGVLRPVPDGQRTPGRTARRGPAGGVPVGVP